MTILERHEPWTGVARVDAPCASVVLVEDRGELVVRLVFSEVIHGNGNDLLLHAGRVIAVSSHDESAHPWRGDYRPVPKLSGRWDRFVYPILRVLDSQWLASFTESQIFGRAPIEHLRIVTLDKTVDILTDEPVKAEWVPSKSAA